MGDAELADAGRPSWLETRVDDDAVTDDAPAADGDGEARVGVGHRVVLEAGLRPHEDALHVAAQNGARPDVGAVLQNDVADDGGVGMDVRIGGEYGYPVTESMDGHERSI